MAFYKRIEMTTTYVIECGQCLQEHSVDADPRDVDKWQKGELIQNAIPYLSADVRELFISGTCGACFDKMFA